MTVRNSAARSSRAPSARFGNRRRKCTVAKMEIPRDRSRPQRCMAETPDEFAPVAASTEQGLERKERGGHRKHDREHRQQAVDIREPLEQRGPGIKQGDHDEQYRFERARDFGDFCGELADLPRARQGEKQGERVDRNEDARHHAQIAEVRQGVGQVVLPYTLHFCADAKVDACGGVPRASRLLAFYSQPWQRNPSPARNSGPGGSPNRYPSSSSATPPRSALTGASRPKTSGRRSRTHACFEPSGS